MKAKSKVMLGLAAMLGVSAAVASYSTYAWFITTRIANTKITSVGAKSNDGNLNVVAVKDPCINLPKYKLDGNDITIDDDDPSNNTRGSNITFTYTATEKNIPLTDVSSDGMTFYKPIWNAKTHGDGHTTGTTANKLSATEIKDVTSGDGDTSAKTGYVKGDEYITDDKLGYFKQFKFQVENTGINPLNVYMSKTDDETPMIVEHIEDGEDASGLSFGGFRLSVVVDDEVVFYYAPLHGDTMNYIKKATAGTKLYDVDERTKATVANVVYGAEGLTSQEISGGADALDTDYQFAPIVDGSEDQLENQMIIEKLEQNDNVDVTINIWVEGESKYTDVNQMDGIVVDFDFNMVALGWEDTSSD